MTQTFLMAIVGGSGAGKTWLAQQLSSMLGLDSARVSLDDFYRDLSELPLDERERVNFDDPEAIDWMLVHEVMDAMAAGKEIRIPCYDFTTHTRREESVSWMHKPVVIWDGLWLLHKAWLRERFQFGVYVDCSLQERLRRRYLRDVNERGRSRESVDRQFHHHVVPMHDQHVLPQKQWATCWVRSPVSPECLARLTEKVRSARTTVES